MYVSTFIEAPSIVRKALFPRVCELEYTHLSRKPIRTGPMRVCMSLFHASMPLRGKFFMGPTVRSLLLFTLGHLVAV